VREQLPDFCERKLNAAKLEQKGMDITTSHNKSYGKYYSYCSGSARYDFAHDKIVIIIIYNKGNYMSFNESLNERKNNFRILLEEIRKENGVNDGKMPFKNSNYAELFRHREGYTDTEKYDDYIKQLDQGFHIEIVYGNTKCQGPLVSKSVLFEE
jgi:hypothetical protein